MKFLKYFPILLVITVFLFACSNNSPYYEKPIKEWLKKNLNDWDSYESVEFFILDSVKLNEYLPELNIQIPSITKAINYKSDIIKELIAFEDVPKPINEEIVSDLGFLKFLTEILNEQIGDLLTIMKYDSILNQKVISILDESNNKDKMEFGMIESKFYISDYTVDEECNVIEVALNKMGSSLKSIKSDLNNGLLIFHSYRAANAFGAKIINRSVFKLDNSKKMVEQALDIVQ